MPNIVKHGKAPREVEVYECEYCGCHFEVPASERMTTFVLHQPYNWPCPECGRNCFSLNRRNIDVKKLVEED